MKKLWRKLALLVRERIRARRLSKLVLALSLIVVFITTYALILPAITVSNSTSSSVIQSQEEPTSSLTETSKTSSSSVESPASKPSSEEDKPATDTNAQETKPSVTPETPKEAETSVAKEAGEQTAESGNVIVKASYPENTFSEKVTLKVTPISNTTAIDNKIKEVLSEKRQTLTVAHSYDISFVNEAGTEVEPNKEVSVSMTFKNTVSDDRLHSEWKLYHFKDNDVNQVEDLTKKADTTINETQSGDVTGVEFKSDKFSTYTIAGVNYANFTGYITDGSYTGKATYTASSKILEASLNLGFKISQADLVKNKNYAFQLPDNVSLGSGLYENQEYTGYDKDSGKEAYKFKVVTVNGKKYMAITFLDSYVNELTPNTDSTGQLHFSASIGEQWKKENGTYEIPFTDKVKITIPSKDIDKHEEPHQEQYDIHSQKTGKVTYDGDTAYLDYTVTVWSDKGTKDTVKVSDNITANGLTLEPLDVVKVERKDYSGWYGEEGTNKQTITGYAVNKGADNKSFNVTLPKLSAKQAYTITYRYKVSTFPAGKDFAVNNKIDVETPNAPHSHTETWLNLHRNKISKSGQYNKDTNKIKWTITVNENHNDIAGAVLKDEMLAKASDVTITPNNGFEKTSDGYKFTAVQNGKNTQKYTITYTPPTGLKLIGFEYGNSIYGIDSGVFTVTDTEIKLQNQYYTGQYGADVDVQGTISNGVVTVTFTAKNGKTLKQALKDTGTLYARFKFKSDADPLDENVKKTYTNKASASIDGKPSGEAEHTQNITVRPGQKLSKNGTWNNTARQLEYNVVLNPEGKDLAAGKDSYTLTDTLTYQEDIPTKLSYDLIQSSVSLVDENNHEVDKSQWSWTVEKTKDASGLYKSILKVKVPNFKKYTLKYKYAVSREVAADNTTQLQVTNTAVIEGLKTGKTEKRVDYKWEKVNAGGTIVSNKAFNITKVDVNNFGIILPEATFEIRENITNKVVATYKTDASGKFSITKNSKNAVTGSQELENNKLYYAIEVKAPAGYELPEESKRTKYYFYFSELDTLPSNIGALTSADVVNLAKQSKSEYVPNTPLPKTTSIKVDKKWLTAEGAQTDRVDGSITVKLIQIATKENAGQGEKPEEVTLRTQTITKANNWTHNFENLPLSGVNSQGQKVTYTYKVVEEKVDGYDTSYSATSPVTSGTITITNKKQKGYVLPNTGGSGLRLLIGMGITLTLLSSSLLVYKFYQQYRKGEQ